MLEAKGRLELNDFKSIFGQITIAMIHAHSAGGVHWDLKPSNIIIYSSEEEQKAFVFDFGIAKILEDSSENHNLMSHCDMAWAKSGTTTLEVALFGKPMLIYYRGSLLDYLVVSLFKTTKLVGMPNILAGQEMVSNPDYDLKTSLSRGDSLCSLRLYRSGDLR